MHEKPAAPAHRQRGETLIEAGVVAAIAAVTVSSAAPNFGGFIANQRLSGAAAALAHDIQFARAEAVQRNDPLRLSVQAQAWGSCYVIHTGSPDQCTCAVAGPAPCGGDAREIKTVQLRGDDGVALSSNVGSVLFDPLHGTSTPTATYRLSTASGRSIQHVVNVMGRVRSCSPLGSVTSYAAC